MVPAHLHAEPLTRALVRKAINQVYYYPSIKKKTEPDQAVAGKTVIQGNDALRTGRNSRSELLFNDRSIARVGSNAIFSFVEGSRQLNLAAGSMLMQVPKGSKNTTIRTAAATAAVTGTTVMMEHEPNSHVKMITLEGTMNVSIPARPGESRTLKAGQMLLFPPDAKRLPEPVTVDLQTLKETAKLIEGFDEEGEDGEESEPTETETETKAEGTETAEDAGEPSDGQTEAAFSTEQINQAIQKQNEKIQEGTLEPTNIVIKGEGTELTLEEPTETEAPEEMAETTEEQESNEEAKETQVKEPTVTELTTISGDEPFVLTGSTEFDLSANPTVTINPTFDGFLYRGGDQGVPDPSQFFFGATSSFDEEVGIDNSGSEFGFVPFAGEAAASFKFSQFDLTGLPAVQRSAEVTALALISEGSTNIGALPGVPSLFLGTQGGDMTVNLPATDVPSSTDLFFYARGSGSSLDLTMSFMETPPELRDGDLLAASQGALNVKPGSNYLVSGRNVNLLANGTLTLERPSSDFMGLIAAHGGDLLLRSMNSDPSSYGIRTGAPIGVSNLFAGALPRDGSVGSLELRTAGSKVGITDMFLGYIPASPTESTTSPFDLGIPSSVGDARVRTNGGAISFDGQAGLAMPGGDILIESGGGRIDLGSETSMGMFLGSISFLESGLDRAGRIRVESGAGNLTVNNAFMASWLINTEGEELSQEPEPGTGGAIDLSSSSGDIMVKDSILGTQGGDVNLTSDQGSIEVRNSTTIETIVEATADGGQITIQSNEGPITLAGDLSQDKIVRIGTRDEAFTPNGTLLIESGSSDFNGSITTKDAQLRASILKMRAHGSSGELIISNNTTLTASDQLKLYSPGSSGIVRFKGNVVLDGGGNAHIRGNTVEITSGSTVEISGLTSTTVYANNHKYDAMFETGQGSFTESGSPVLPNEESLSEAPDF